MRTDILQQAQAIRASMDAAAGAVAGRNELCKRRGIRSQRPRASSPPTSTPHNNIPMDGNFRNKKPHGSLLTQK